MHQIHFVFIGSGPIEGKLKPIIKSFEMIFIIVVSSTYREFVIISLLYPVIEF